MIRTLKRHGNSLGLTIEKPILELLKIDENTPLEIQTDGERLIITPVRTSHKDRVMEAARRTTKNHAKTLRKLAE